MESSAHETIFKSFRLAYFIYRERQTALGITAQALSALHEQLKPQQRRIYYRLQGRISGGLNVKARNKIALEESQKLQSLIYIYSERVEKQQEATLLLDTPELRAQHAISEDDWIVRFLKHLISITVTQSAFYVTLGIGRIAFNYTTEETALIYDTIIQDQNCRKDSPYFRKRKNEFLMKSLKERFGCFVETHHVAHGEERFKARSDSKSFLPLVNSCLNAFTPWNTDCVLPGTIDLMTEINELCFDRNDPDEEHPVEARRMHAVIHPDCFYRLVSALELPKPEQKVDIPMFFFDRSGNSNGTSNGSKRQDPPPLTEAELLEVEKSVRQNYQRRKRLRPESVSLFVDDIARGSMTIDEAPRLLKIKETSRLIELKGLDNQGELLLGSLLLDKRELLTALPSKDYRLGFTDGSELLLKLSPSLNADNEFYGADIELTFRRAKSLGTIQNFIQVRLQQISIVFKRPAPLFMSLLILLVAVLIGIAIWSSPRRPLEHVAQIQPSPSMAVNPPTNSNDEISNQQPTNQSSPGRKTSRDEPPDTIPNGNKAAEEIRALPSETSQELSSVRKIYVEQPNNYIEERTYGAVLRTIDESGILRTTDEAGADAFLVLEVKEIATTKQIRLRLSNRIGKQLWSATRRISTKQNVENVTTAMLQELVSKITL